MMKLILIAAVFAEGDKKAEEVTKCSETKDCEKNQANKKCVVATAKPVTADANADKTADANADKTADPNADKETVDPNADKETVDPNADKTRRLSEKKEEEAKKDRVACKDVKAKCEAVVGEDKKDECEKASDDNCEFKDKKCVLKETACECSATTASVFVALAALAMLF